MGAEEVKNNYAFESTGEDINICMNKCIKLNTLCLYIHTQYILEAKKVELPSSNY